MTHTTMSNMAYRANLMKGITRLFNLLSDGVDYQVYVSKNFCHYYEGWVRLKFRNDVLQFTNGYWPTTFDNWLRVHKMRTRDLRRLYHALLMDYGKKMAYKK